MQKLRLNAKTGFYSPGAVKVYDNRGLFLAYNGPAYFNMPPGSYYAEGNIITKLNAPIQYESLELQPATKPRVDPNKVNIRITKSTQTPKMAIDYETGEMLINPSWEATLTTPQYEGATRHETGHYFYHGDAPGQYNCDRFAIQTMLEDGFNPPQIKDAFSNILCSKCSEESAWRTANIAKEMDRLENTKDAKFTGKDLYPFENFENLNDLWNS
jgi:hypothetical protein